MFHRIAGTGFPRQSCDMLDMKLALSMHVCLVLWLNLRSIDMHLSIILLAAFCWE